MAKKLENVDGLLVDLDRVFYVGDGASDGAIEALRGIRERNLPCRFLTNTTTRTASSVVDKLDRLGFDPRRGFIV